MARKKKADVTAEAAEANGQQEVDRHRQSRMMRLPKPFADLLDVLADRHLSSPGEELKRAVRLYLEAEGLWPPQPPAGDKARRG